MLEEKNGSIRIRLNCAVYAQEVLDKAVKDFSDCCDIRLIREGLFSTVEIRDSKNKTEDGFLDAKDVALHFCDYILNMMKDRFVGLAYYERSE